MKQRQIRHRRAHDPVRLLHAQWAGWTQSDEVWHGPNGASIRFVHSDPAGDLRGIAWVGPDTPFSRTYHRDPTDPERVMVLDHYGSRVVDVGLPRDDLTIDQHDADWHDPEHP